MNTNTVTKRKTKPKLKPPDGILVYFIIGLVLGAFLVKKLNPEQKPIIADAIVNKNIELSKAQLINEILKTINLGEEAFSEQILPIIRKEIALQNNPEFNTLADDKFWAALKAENSSILLDVKKEYQKLAIDFFDQFSEVELQAYLNSKRSPQAKKIQDILNAKRRKFVTSNDELKSEVRALVHKFIQNNPKNPEINPTSDPLGASTLDNTDLTKQNENVPEAQPDKK